MKKTHKGTTYFLRGTDPKLLILSGTHGDEYEVTEFVTRYIEAHQDSLPDYLYIPEVSPSAVALKTRRNKHNRDLNRHFLPNPIDNEVKAAMEIIRQFRFLLCVAFHEDPDRTTSFYTYDSQSFSDAEILSYRSYMTNAGVKLFTGIDDPEDKDLAGHVEQGYIATPMTQQDLESGFSMPWMIHHGVARRVFNPEIPGKATRADKNNIVSAFFTFSLQYI